MDYTEAVERLLDLEELVTSLTDAQFAELTGIMRQHGFALEQRFTDTPKGRRRVLWIEPLRTEQRS